MGVARDAGERWFRQFQGTMEVTVKQILVGTSALPLQCQGTLFWVVGRDLAYSRLPVANDNQLLLRFPSLREFLKAVDAMVGRSITLTKKEPPECPPQT